MTYPKTTLGAALILVVFSGIYLTQTLSLVDSGVSTSSSGPTVYPLTIGVPMAILSIVFLCFVVFRILRDKNAHKASSNLGATEGSRGSSETPEEASPSFRIEAPLVLAATVVHVLLLPVLGYILSTILYAFVTVYIVSGRYQFEWGSVMKTAAFSVVVSIGSYAALDLGLGIPLPDSTIVGLI